MHRTVMELTGWDARSPTASRPNRQVLEELIRSAVDQKILDRAPRLEDVFTADTRDVVAWARCASPSPPTTTASSSRPG